MTPKKQKALLALLSHPTKTAAAAAAGITPKTLRSYLAEPEFQAEYKKAFASLVEDTTRQAQQAIAPALSTLRDVVEDSSEGAQFRISAARSILEQDEVVIDVDLNEGEHEATCWGCDLTYDYVKINGDYRT